jgi:hypothetical protein
MFLLSGSLFTLWKRLKIIGKHSRLFTVDFSCLISTASNTSGGVHRKSVQTSPLTNPFPSHPFSITSYLSLHGVFLPDALLTKMVAWFLIRVPSPKMNCLAQQFHLMDALAVVTN